MTKNPYSAPTPTDTQTQTQNPEPAPRSRLLFGLTMLYCCSTSLFMVLMAGTLFLQAYRFELAKAEAPPNFKNEFTWVAINSWLMGSFCLALFALAATGLIVTFRGRHFRWAFAMVSTSIVLFLIASIMLRPS